MAEKKTGCAERVYRDGWSGNCCRDGTILEDGKRWCWQHSPSVVKQRKVEWEAKYQAEQAATDRKFRIEDARRAVVKAAEAFADSGPHNCAEQGRLRAAVEVLREARGAEVA